MTILFAYFIHCLTSFFYWRCPHSMRSRVYETVRCPSICPSVCPIRGSGFAAMGPSGRTYRSIAVRPALQQHEDTAQRAAANAGSATFPAAEVAEHRFVFIQAARRCNTVLVNHVCMKYVFLSHVWSYRQCGCLISGRRAIFRCMLYAWCAIVHAAALNDFNTTTAFGAMQPYVESVTVE